MAKSHPLLVVLGASPRVAEVAARLPAFIVHVVAPGTNVECLTEPGVRVLTADYRSEHFPDFVRLVLPAFRPGAVVSLTGDGVLPAAVANEQLGLPGVPSQVVERFLDKRLMRETLEAAGLQARSLRFASPVDGAEAFRIAATWRADRAVLKPVVSTVSAGVEIIATSELKRHGSMGDVLIEEYIPGQEYSAETFGVNGRHRLLALAQRVVGPSFVETGHVVPPVVPPPIRVDEIERQVEEVLLALGLTEGPAHTELKIGADGIRIIRSDARMGGDDIGELVRLTTGIDITAWSLGWPLGLPLPRRSSDVAPAAAVSFALAPVEPISVERIELPHVATAPAELVDIWAPVSPGTALRSPTSSTDHIARAMVTAPTPGAALTAAGDLAARIRVVAKTAGAMADIKRNRTAC